MKFLFKHIHITTHIHIVNKSNKSNKLNNLTKMYSTIILVAMFIATSQCFVITTTSRAVVTDNGKRMFDHAKRISAHAKRMSEYYQLRGDLMDILTGNANFEGRNSVKAKYLSQYVAIDQLYDCTNMISDTINSNHRPSNSFDDAMSSVADYDQFKSDLMGILSGTATFEGRKPERYRSQYDATDQLRECMNMISDVMNNVPKAPNSFDDATNLVPDVSLVVDVGEIPKAANIVPESARRGMNRFRKRVTTLF